VPAALVLRVHFEREKSDDDGRRGLWCEDAPLVMEGEETDVRGCLSGGAWMMGGVGGADEVVSYRGGIEAKTR